jgi:hypothetical protein
MSRLSLFAFRLALATLLAIEVLRLLLPIEGADMADPKSQSEDQERDLRQAHVTAATAVGMRRMLEGLDLEIVGRGPHQAEDGTWFADIIAPQEVLDAMPKDLGTVEVRAPRRLLGFGREQVSEGNRYLERGSVPRGVGIKE